MTSNLLYDQDFYAWANEQASLLREGRLSEADTMIAAFRRARGRAALETGLAEAVFPLSGPWTFEQVMAPGFWPEST